MPLTTAAINDAFAAKKSLSLKFALHLSDKLMSFEALGEFVT